MSSSIDENCDSKLKDADVKFAQADAAPDLKVAEDRFALRLAVPESDAETPCGQTKPAASSTEDRSTATPEAPMPRFLTGVATVMCFWFFNFMGSYSLAMSNFTSWHGPMLWAFCAIGALAVHLGWFANSLKQLRARTSIILPECQPAPRQNLLLTLLPASWMGLFVLCIWQQLLSTTSPGLEIMPWMILISALYWIVSLCRWPFKISAIGKAERLARIRDKNLALDPRVFAALREISRYAAPIAALGLSSFAFTLPYIWSWKVEIDKAEALDKAKSSAKQLESDPNKLVIRYRTFAGTERWVRQRLTSNSGNRLKNGAIALGSMILFGSALIFIVAMLVGNNIHWIASLFQSNTEGSITSQTNNAFYNAMVLKTVGLCGTISLICAAIIYRRQPTHYEFTPQGFRSFRWGQARKVPGKSVLWSQVAQVGLSRRSQRTQVNDLEIEFKLIEGNPLRLKLGSIESVEDREAVLRAIERWAPHVSRDAELVQVLQPPVDHSYTELWLQALTAPPRRDRLNPLTENTLVGEGRYRVRRALGVGGQGAAYEAFDSKAGELVVLKEFLLPIYVDVSVRKEVLERFEGEARILKNLNHPQIVKLADYFVEDHRAYLVLEHIDGLSLRETVAKQGPLPEAQVKGLAQQMCSILTYLHQQAPPVVHRDFTPENLILRTDGTLKLIDFNVARQVESAVTSSVVGKPAYLPPEQFRGTPVPQSDIYGLGATLAFLLTGKDPEPINASHPRETMASVSKNMDELVAHATAIEVRDRYQNCDDILNDLDYEISQQIVATETLSAEQQIEKNSAASLNRKDEDTPHVAT